MKLSNSPITYIFDLDGTLLDTLDDLAAATNYALRAHGLPEHSTEDVRNFVGNGVCMLIQRAVPNGTPDAVFEDVLDTFRKYYLEHSLDCTRPYDGIVETLNELKARGCKLAVVSNKFMTATKELVRHFFPMIEVAIGENETEGIRKKPAPDTVLEALRRLEVQLPCEKVSNQEMLQSRVYYVGDSDVDIETARSSGLPCISVLWGFRDRSFLEAHGATTFISRPEELLTLNIKD